jgi:xanthine dehydrogenase YagT iron-sulfur-binding subunit
MKRFFSLLNSGQETTPDGVSRRAFLRGLGSSAVVAATIGTESMAQGLAQANAERVYGPGATAIELIVNGERRTLQVEPRVTLLEALRGPFGLTGTKEACDRGTCGACTVLLNGEPVYACSVLAIDVQGAEITTIEGLAPDGRLTALQQSFIDKDGLQCGYCSPGMVMTLTALLRKNPHPTEDEVRKACSGNLCRCGSYPRIFAAALSAAGVNPPEKLTVLAPHEHGLA